MSDEKSMGFFTKKSWITLHHKALFLIRTLRSLNKLNINLPEISYRYIYINPPLFQIHIITNINFEKIISKEINSTIVNANYLDIVNSCLLDYIKIF